MHVTFQLAAKYLSEGSLPSQPWARCLLSRLPFQQNEAITVAWGISVRKPLPTYRSLHPSWWHLLSKEPLTKLHAWLQQTPAIQTNVKIKGHAGQPLLPKLNHRSQVRGFAAICTRLKCIYTGSVSGAGLARTFQSLVCMQVTLWAPYRRRKP